MPPLRVNIETSHIPVLLLTALGDEKNMLEGLKIGRMITWRNPSASAY